MCCTCEHYVLMHIAFLASFILCLCVLQCLFVVYSYGLEDSKRISNQKLWVIRFGNDKKNMHLGSMYFLAIWTACLIKHVKCSCTSIALAVSSIIVNLLETASAGINCFGPGWFWLLYVSKEVWFTSGFVNQTSEHAGFLARDQGQIWTWNLLPAKGSFSFN